MAEAVVLIDQSGSFIGTVPDKDDPQKKRVFVQSELKPGSSIGQGPIIPSNPADLIVSFLTSSSGTSTMLVDGTTPVTFAYSPLSGTVLSVDSVLVIFSADNLDFDGKSFGPLGTEANSFLTQGIKFETHIEGNTAEIFVIKYNEDFLRLPGYLPFVNNTGPKDILTSAFVFAGSIKLNGSSGDAVRMTIRDDLTSVKLKYLTATIYGTKE